VIYFKHGTQFYTLVTEYSKTRRKTKVKLENSDNKDYDKE